MSDSSTSAPQGETTTDANTTPTTHRNTNEITSVTSDPIPETGDKMSEKERATPSTGTGTAGRTGGAGS